MLLLTIPGAVKLATLPVSAQVSNIATTQVTDTVYLADGTTATGTVIVSWQAFTNAIGQAVPAGTTSATIGAGGALSLQLAPNAGATPMGTYYTAIYHLNDGSVSREFWVVPVSQAPVAVSAIKSTVIPTSVAMQTVSKSYVDTAIATAISGHPLDSTSPYVLITGSTMTGPLVLPGDPTTTNEAADKHYVDANISAAGAGLGQKVSLLPTTTQQVVQPVGSQLQVNLLNGEEYASQYVTGLGNNGIANAMSSPDCAAGCNVTVDRSYASSEGYASATWNSGSGGTHLEDDRNGQRRDQYLNPTSVAAPGQDAGQTIDVVSTRSTAAEFASGASSEEPASEGLAISHEALGGGNNLFPQSIEGTVPYFKTGYSALVVGGTYNAMGEHVLAPHQISCYGVGDCLIGSQFLTASGGFRDEADEGTHPMDIQIQEDSAVFQGTCGTGCTTGSTLVKVTPTSASGTQGEGRFLIDKNPAQVMSAGSLVGGTMQTGTEPGSVANFSGTNFPVSVFLATAQVVPSQSNNIAPGTVTIPIETSGVPAGFATSTTSIPGPSGVACVTEPGWAFPSNYEMVNYTIVDGTHLQMTFNKVHHAGSTIAVGGLCGYGLEETVDTANGIRQLFPVIGAYSSTSLYYAGGAVAIVGNGSQTGGFLNVSLQIASIVRSNNVVTVTTAGNFPVDVNGLTMNVSGVADSSYNGSFSVTTTGANTLTYADTGANSSSTGGTLAVLTGGYALYPMAEVLGVFDAATKSVDGQMTLAPNTVRWSANDPVEEPHYYQEKISADVTYVTQTTPRPTSLQVAGIQYQTSAGPGLVGWMVNNAVPASNYFGNGGTHSAPQAAYEAEGIWQRTLDGQAGEQSVFSIHCNSHGCGRWNSAYDLFELDNSTGGYDSIVFQPTTSTLTMKLRGVQYGFSPQAFTVGTINAGTVNATTLNGAVSAAQLPVMGASGSGHSQGAVPDPGATAGTTRYLREDGSWSVPAGGGSGASGVADITGGTIDGAVIGGTTPSTVSATHFEAAVSGAQFLAFNENSVNCKFCNYFSPGIQWGQGQLTHQMSLTGDDGVSGGYEAYDSIAFYVGTSPNGATASNSVASVWNTGLIFRNGAVMGWNGSATGSATAGTVPVYAAGFSYGGSAATVDCGDGTARDTSCAFQAGSGTFSGNVTAANLRSIFAGTTGSIGGAALAAGSCATGTAAVAGATVGSPVAVAAADGSLPSGLVTLSAGVTSAGTVTVQVCAIAGATPAAKMYNVRVLQ
jgi:hypothetical protein